MTRQTSSGVSYATPGGSINSRRGQGATSSTGGAFAPPSVAAATGAAAAAASFGSTREAVPAQKERERVPAVCFRCRQPGHVARYCTQPADVQSIAVKATERGRVGDSDADGDVTDTERGLKRVEIDGLEWCAKIDTEAEITVIARSAAEQMGLELEPARLKRIRGVGGSSVPVGQCLVTVKLDGLVHKKVLLTVLPDDALSSEAILLGKDLLDRKELVTVYREGVALVLSADAYPEIARLSPIERKVKFIAQHDTRIPSRSVCLVEVEATGLVSGAVILEGDECDVLCQVRNSQAMVPISNLGLREVTIAKGTVLKRGELLEESETVLFKEREDGDSVARVHQVRNDADEVRKDQLMLGDGVPGEVRAKLRELVNRYRSVFASSMSKLGKTSLAQFEIAELPGSGPVASKPYRLSLAEREALRRIISEMTAAGMVRPSQSPYDQSSAGLSEPRPADATCKRGI